MTDGAIEAEQGSTGTADVSGESKKGARKPVIAGFDPDVFGDINVALKAILGEGSLTVRQLLDLTEGDIVDLGTPLDGKIDLTLNDRLIAQGEIVAVGDKFGVRISKIVAEKK